MNLRTGHHTHSSPRYYPTPRMGKHAPFGIWACLLVLSLATSALLWGHVGPYPPPGKPDGSGGASDGGPNAGSNGGGSGGVGGGSSGGSSRASGGLARAPGVGGGAVPGLATGQTCPPTEPDPNNNPPGDPVYLGYATAYISDVDVPTLPSRGQSGNAALGFNRFYTSGARTTDGPLGIGWTHNYNILLDAVLYDHVTISRWDGREITFTSGDWVTFTPPPGESSTLRYTGGNYVWKLQHGTTYTFNGATWQLINIKDRQANTLTLSYDSGTGLLTNIVDAASRRIAIQYDANWHIQRVIDPLNQTNTFTYVNGLLRSVSDSIGTRVTYYYNDDNNGNDYKITRVVDARNNTHRYVYDASGAVVSETNALSAAQTYAWDWANWKVTVTNYSGLWAYTDSFDSSGRQLSYTNTLGNIQYKRQSGTGLLTNYVDLMGYKTTNIWNTNAGALLMSIDPLGLTNAWSYDANFLYVQRFTNAAGKVSQFAYDSTGNLTNHIDPGNNTTRFTYDAYGNPLTMVDPNLRTNRFGYDTYGHLTSVTNALTNIWRLGYDVLGRLVASTNPLSKTNGLAWDARRRLVRVIDGTGAGSGFAYDANGNCVAWTNGLGYITSYGYDAANRLTNVTLPVGGGPFLKIGYDKMGNLTRITNALGYTNSFGYDAANRLTSVTNALTKVWNFTLNANGWRTQTVDPNTRTNQYNYDAGGRLTAWTNGLRNRVQYQYNSLYRLTNIIDARGNALGFVYQDCCDGRLTQIKFGSSDLEQFIYDPAGNRTNFVNRAGNVVRSTYDAAHRLTQKDFVSASDVVQYGYDAADQLTNAVWTVGAGNTNSILSLAYDAAGRLTNEVQKIGTGSSLNVGYEYFADGRRKKLVYPDGSYLTYDYNNNGWLTAIKDNGSATIASFLYDAAGNRTNRALANNTTTVYQYDVAGRLTNLVNKITSSGMVISSYAYGYDNAGNRAWMKRSSSRGDVYKYDAAYQVTNVVYDATTPEGTPGAGTNQVTYTIDAAGNWTLVKQVVPGVSTNNTSIIVNELNQYTNINGSAYLYDRNGNLTSYVGNAFFYDYENRLRSATVSGLSYTNTYDALGRWVGRYRGSWARYYYAGWQLVDERDGAGTQVAEYVYGPGLDEPIRVQRSGTSYYYHTDGLGNITEVTDGSGNLVEQYTYDIYGTPTIRNSGGTIIAASAIGNRWLFQGRDWDAGVKLYNYRYRIYNPNIGRFMQTDPVREVGPNGLAEYWNVNLYCFVENSPVSYGDPYGYSLIGKGVAKLCKLGAKGVRKIFKQPLTLEEAVDAVKAGEDVLATNRKTAKEIAEAAGGGKNPIHEIDHRTGGRHYHTADRTGGHVLYNVAAALTASHYAEGNGAIVEGIAAVADLFNPLSVPQDIIDIKDALFGE